jgi:hypothetical protein
MMRGLGGLRQRQVTRMKVPVPQIAFTSDRDALPPFLQPEEIRSRAVRIRTGAAQLNETLWAKRPHRTVGSRRRAPSLSRSPSHGTRVILVVNSRQSGQRARFERSSWP